MKWKDRIGVLVIGLVGVVTLVIATYAQLPSDDKIKKRLRYVAEHQPQVLAEQLIQDITAARQVYPAIEAVVLTDQGVEEAQYLAALPQYSPFIGFLATEMSATRQQVVNRLNVYIHTYVPDATLEL